MKKLFTALLVCVSLSGFSQYVVPCNTVQQDGILYNTQLYPLQYVPLRLQFCFGYNYPKKPTDVWQLYAQHNWGNDWVLICNDPQPPVVGTPLDGGIFGWILFGGVAILGCAVIRTKLIENSQLL